MNKEKTVTIKVASNEGHTEFSLTAPKAIEKINEIYQNDGKWLYIDGANVLPSRISESMLLAASSITMLDAMVGGHDCRKPDLSGVIDLHIAKFTNEDGNSVVEGMDERSIFPITIELVPPNPENLTTEPRIRVWVNEDNIVEVAHLRTLLFKGSLAKLEEWIYAEVDKFKKTLNV